MNNQKLIIYRFSSLYHTLKELEQDLNFEVFEASNEKNLNNLVLTLQNYLIVTSKKISNKNQYLILDKLPIKFSKLIENLNIKFLKNKFVHQSKIEIKNYLIDLNSREMSFNDIRLKLTEKEINTIIYLSNKKKPISIKELQTKVWSYQSGMETHTVETHIYRLRKKILKTFNDENLLLSKKNGYQIS
ncbi:winged helix-turn-helix domain-containing protein [Candidatus Pelagibacter sp.]|nr:winged helix-turn-helix domain-containing protein [Candidatus Pelagibacter sp.]